MNSKKTAVDEKWYFEFKEILKATTVDEYQHFSGVFAKERVKFFEDTSVNPVFLYPHSIEIKHGLQACNNLFSRIEKEEKNNIVKDLYLKKIESQILRLKLLSAHTDNDDFSFFEASRNLYGSPNKTYLEYVVKKIKAMYSSSYTTEQTRAFERLFKVLTNIKTDKVSITSDVLPEPVLSKDDKSLSALEIKKIFEDTISRYSLVGWKVAIDESCTKQNFSVSNETQQVNVPCDDVLSSRRKHLTELKAWAIAEHEIGVHARRNFEGEKQTLKLLSVGLPKYLRGEEGLASYVQQNIEGSAEYYGFERYLCASLAVGLDGIKRDFKETYKLMYDYFTLAIKPDNNHNEKVKLATWGNCVRTFRGTSGSTRGAIYSRDILYLEGNIDVWKLLIKNPQALPELFIGKFDPTNKEHVNALQELDILSDW